MRTSPSAARERVFERDRGVCARCGLDTEDLKGRLAAMRRRNPVPDALEEARRLSSGFERAVLLRARRPWIAIRRALWEADHVVPVVEGGGGCGLDNLRTLCIPCHHAETRGLARRRAAARQEPGGQSQSRESEIGSRPANGSETAAVLRGRLDR
ncbi:MAG: HNH endonuclease [Thermoanaerobaculia bacterium]|nr:HNH endonuclease [Acidobacteriota bacterium]